MLGDFVAVCPSFGTDQEITNLRLTAYQREREKWQV